MPQSTIAILHPGAMGAAVGACLRSRGHRVVWSSEGRSSATLRRAQAAGLEDLGSLPAALAAAEFAFAICPPDHARDLARAVAATGYAGVYVDANAVAAPTAIEIGDIAQAGGAQFVDGGIVGLPPREPGRTRLYLAGRRAADTAALFAGSALGAIALDGPAGSASALKICYAAWSKGATALLAAIRALARSQGIEAALLDEWRLSTPPTVARSEEVAAKAEKAWRWVGEMEEIAASFRQAGLPAGFHLAAADLYKRLEVYKDVPEPPAMDDVLARLLAG